MEKKEVKYKYHYIDDLRKLIKEGDYKYTEVLTYNLEIFINNLLDKELDKAREEGYENCMDDIWERARELRSWTEHDGNVSADDIDEGLKEAYLEISKLKQ